MLSQHESSQQSFSICIMETVTVQAAGPLESVKVRSPVCLIARYPCFRLKSVMTWKSLFFLPIAVLFFRLSLETSETRFQTSLID
jgi:membrane-bound metal-dependent hydrolase YbcI (DUF457 family)